MPSRRARGAAPVRLVVGLVVGLAAAGAGWPSTAQAAVTTCSDGLLRPALFSTLEVRAGTIPAAHAQAEESSGAASWSSRPPGAESSGASGPATVTVSYDGFPAEAIEAFEAAVSTWEQTVASSVPITVEARFEPLGTDVLGGAAPAMFVRDPVRSTPWYPVALADAISGSDLFPRSPDIVARFNSNDALWYFGTDGQPPADRFDFATVALHELSHGLGLIGGFSVDDDGTASWASSPSDRYPTIFDTFVADADGGHLVETRPNHSGLLADALTAGPLVFDGPAARQAGDGAAPRLYAPSAWEAGTSVYHLDRGGLDPDSPDRLIGPALPPGLAIHRLGPLLRGIFLDLGWARPASVNAADASDREVAAAPNAGRAAAEADSPPAPADQPEARDLDIPAPTDPVTRPGPTPATPTTPTAPATSSSDSSTGTGGGGGGGGGGGTTLAAPERCEPETEASGDPAATVADSSPGAGTDTEEVASPIGAGRPTAARVSLPSNALALTSEASPFPWLAGAAMLVLLGEILRRRATGRSS